ncbi:MAG: hypothetical protein AB1847_17555 [bacterium]
MNRDLALDTEGDILIQKGDLVLISGIDAIRQHLSQKIKTFYGEWFLHMAIGVPYFQQVFVKNPNLQVIDSIFKREIINTPGIVQLLEFNLNINSSTRVLNLVFKARTDEGIIDFNEVVS